MGLDSKPRIKKEPGKKVNEHACSSMRKLGHEGYAISEIMNATDIDITKSTLRYHLFGKCTHGKNSDEFTSPVPKEIVKNGGPGPSHNKPEVALYPCGDLRFNDGAMKKWGLGGLPAAEIHLDKGSCEIWIFFKQVWSEEYHLVDHNKTSDYSARIQGTDVLLNELRISKPHERILLDFEWKTDNNVLYIDMISAV